MRSNQLSYPAISFASVISALNNASAQNIRTNALFACASASHIRAFVSHICASAWFICTAALNISAIA